MVGLSFSVRLSRTYLEPIKFTSIVQFKITHQFIILPDDNANENSRLEWNNFSSAGIVNDKKLPAEILLLIY